MSLLHISEYRGILRTNVGEDPISGDGVAQAVQEPALAEQSVTFSTATQSAAFNNATRLVGVSWGSACHILFGANPTATTSSKYRPGSGVEYFGVNGGDKLSVIDAA